ncbi:hypothetical protein SAMN02745111_01092 [Eubacterium uniforme]|uniref:Uncharacterized protein n=2 Tax=Eubacterium uniforme TaxID=39495 RepID=A0A1T4VKB3_9FIRM|nr:hypothetical protein SAMN02745111_01092 [Eubacterium uniforme]
MGGWIFYISSEVDYFEKDKVGKWMYFFEDEERVDYLCRKAVEDGIVVEAKHSDSSEGVSCFYLNMDDYEGHRRVIEFFIENDMIRRTKAGRLYNISFKLDAQTRAGEYGENFNAELKLENLVNLMTGEWIYNK